MLQCRERKVINNMLFDELPVLSLCNKVGGLEGRSRLELVLLKPAREQQGGEGEGGEEGATWQGCAWELHLCEELEQRVAEEVVVDGQQDQDQQGQKTEKEQQQQELMQESGELSQPTTVTTVTERVVLCRWADTAAFDPLRWHSIALSLRASSGGADSGSGEDSGGGSVELTVDGTGRMKMDGSFEEGSGVAAAWLPVAPAAAGAGAGASSTPTAGANRTEELTEGMWSQLANVVSKLHV